MVSFMFRLIFTESCKVINYIYRLK
uniref:Uncharacterized protein n=1 Tax=Timema shepardi TaxID=629360 RepID=A0A7R9BAI6_TIMSH|nr:unnamed protein product [Timema shepardi]